MLPAYFEEGDGTNLPPDVGYILFYNGTLVYNYALEVFAVVPIHRLFNFGCSL